ncbi:MAG: CPBP family glutamic-type intramembrane protease, partial [Streptococcus mitis]|nr:CPBP family glutamic-type intramembrane protease [Streptococcus mitis]
SLADIFVYTAVGCLFAWLTRYTKSIYPSFSIHIVNNIIANLPFLLTFLHRVLG